MSNPATLEDLKGRTATPGDFKSCFAKCMFSMAGCCLPITFTPKFIDENTVHMVDNAVCYCGRMSPFPCCLGCARCITPCQYEPKFTKESDTKWVGQKVSALKGGFCGFCVHEGQAYIYKNGDEWIYHAGNAPANPPCLAGKDITSIVFYPKKSGAVAPAPVSDMQR